ncbi:unnamed protein product [Calypogeia fissa]
MSAKELEATSYNMPGPYDIDGQRYTMWVLG